MELAEQTLEAIRHGRVDALVVEGPRGDEIYTLTGADRPYRIMVEEMQEGALALREDGAVLYCNRQMAAILGASPEKLLGSSFFDWIAPLSKRRFQSLIEGCAGSGCRAEGELQAAGGNTVPVHLSVNPLRVGESQLVSVVVTDLTEHKRHEARLQQQTAELAAANEELEAFSYTVSHDLRAPLRHITGFIELLEDCAGAGLDEESRRYLRIIRQSADRMGSLIDDLLTLSRLGRADIHVVEVDLHQLVDEVIRDFARETSERTIDWQIGALPRVYGDRNLLRTAVANLVSNAIKYTRPRNSAQIQIGSQERDNDIVCFVRDNGVGFDMRFAHKLFGVFQRLHDIEEFEGTGIGLASVRRVIQRHGGRTWAEGTEGSGATFYFSLPARRSSHA